MVLEGSQMAEGKEGDAKDVAGTSNGIKAGSSKSQVKNSFQIIYFNRIRIFSQKQTTI